MTMLPDIDQTTWDDYQSQELQRQMDEKNRSFGLGHLINDKIAGLQGLVAQANTPPFAPSPPLPPPPEPEPAPPPPAPVKVDNQQDWMAQAISAVGRAGGDVQTFASNLGSGAGDQMGNAISAAGKAGADVQQFASSLPAVPLPPPPPPPERYTPPTPAAAPSVALPGAGATAGPGGDLRDYARGAAARAGVDPDIFVRQIQQESGFDPTAKSPAGATGIAQFMPGTAQGMGVDPSDPYAALDAAARLDAQHLKAYGGDYSKALAAYNAGPGNVEKYGGVPPFEETQRYVKTILGGAKDAVGGAFSAVGTGAQGVVTAGRQAANQISQFGDKQLTNDEAYAACGPAAAVRFASMYGRNPSLREATDLAAQVGWTSANGMAGLASEKSLMDKLGVATKMVSGGQWDVFAKEAQSGNPVTISTPGHYFFADGYDPNSGAFHVGRSGSDLKSGSEWMTPAQMEAVMGKVQGGLLADNPSVPAPSHADQDTNPVGWLGRFKDSVTSNLGGVGDRLGSSRLAAAAGDVGSGVGNLGDLMSQGYRGAGSALGEDASLVADAAQRLGDTRPVTLVDSATRGLSGRLGQVAPQTMDDFTKPVQAPSQDDWLGGTGLGQSGLGQLAGRGASLLGTGLNTAGDIGKELIGSPMARMQAGEEVLLQQDPSARSVLEANGITPDMDSGSRARAMLAMSPADQATLQAATRRVRAMDPEVVSSAAFQSDTRRKELEDNYNTLLGLISMGVAPQGLASGAGRFAASLAIDPAGAPLNTLGAVPDLLRAARGAAPAAGDALGIVQRTGRDLREGLYGPGEAGTFLPREQLPNSSVWENALGEGARYGDGAGEGGFHGPALETARLTPETAGLQGEDRIRQVISDLEFNPRFPSDLTDPEANQFARDLQGLGRGMATGDWTPEQTTIAAVLTKLSQGRPQRSVSGMQENLGDEWMLRHMPSFQTQGAVPGGQAAAYGMVSRPEVVATHISGDTGNPAMMKFLTAVGRPSLEELGPGAVPELASFATRAERDQAIREGSDELFRQFSAAGHGGAKGDDTLINGADIVRNYRDKATGEITRTSVSQAADTGRQAWADTVPALHNKMLDWARGEGDYAGLDELGRKNKLLEDIQNANVAGVGIDKATFVPNMGFNPDYATLDLRMRRQGFGLSPKAILTRAERNLLEQKIIKAFPEADSPYVAQWLPWAYMTDEKTDYRSIPGIYNKVGDFVREAQDQARQTGRPLGEVMGSMAEKTPRVPVEYPYSSGRLPAGVAGPEAVAGPGGVVTRLGVSPQSIRNLAPGTAGEDLYKAAPELKSFADQAGVQFVEKPSVGTGIGFDAAGNPKLQPDANLVVSGTEASNRWFGAAWLAANPDEPSVMLAHTGVEGATDALGSIRLANGATDAQALAQALSEFQPDGMHLSLKMNRAGQAMVTDLSIGARGQDADKLSGRMQEFANVLESEGFNVKSAAAEPARIEILQQSDVEGIIHGGPRGARPALEGETGGLAGSMGAGGRDWSGSLPASWRPDLLGGGASEDLGGLRNAAGIVSRGASAGLRSDLARGAVAGAVGGGYSAAQEPGATPQDIALGALGGGALGAARGAIPGLNAGRLTHLANIVGRDGREITNGDGQLLPRSTPLEDKLWVPGRTGSDLSKLVSPAGNLLSTVAAGVTDAGREATSISRTLLGAEPWTYTPPEDARKALPNLLHMANGMPDVQASLARTSEDSAALMDKYRQGSVSHDELLKLAAESVGMTADDFRKTEVGKAFKPEELVALRGSVVKSTDDMTRMATEIQRQGGVGSLDAVQKLNVVQKMLEAAHLQAVGVGAASTAGRALNSQRINITRAISESLTKGTELRKSTEALTAARAREAWASSKLGVKPRRGGIDDAVGPSPAGDAIRGQAKTAAEAYQQRISAWKDELRADGKYDAKNWESRLKELEDKATLGKDAGLKQALAAERARVSGAYDNVIDATRAELEAQNNFDKKTWDATLAKLEKEHQTMKQRGSMWNPKDATTPEGEKAWLQGLADSAKKEANAENNRNIAAWNRQLRDRETQQALAGKILGRLGGEKVTDQMLKGMIEAMASGDKMRMAKYLQGLQKVSWWDRIGTLRYGSMLSAAATHEAQLVGNTAMLGMGMATHPLAVGADLLRTGVGRALGKDVERERYMSELPAMLRGMKGGFMQGKADALETLKTGINPAEVDRNWEKTGGAGMAIEQTPIGRVLGQRGSNAFNAAAEGPLRLLSAGDSLIRGTARGAYTNGLAERQAIREGFSGAARRDRVGEITRNLHEFPELVAQADDAAKRIVLQEGRKEVAPFQQRHGIPGALTSLVMPFVRTPYNIAAQGAGLTPAGYLAAIEALRKGNTGEFADRAARATLGTGIMAGGMALAANDHLTGAMPTDPSERSTLPPGWLPYALKLQLPGQDQPTYHKYSNLAGPIGVPLALASAMVDAHKDNRHVEPGDIVRRMSNYTGKMTGTFGRYMLDQTMLQGMGNLYDAVGDPDRYGENFLESSASQFAPYAALSRSLDRALGTSPRDPHGILDALEAQYPGLSGQVQPRLDSLGRPVQETQSGLGGVLSPTRYATEQADPTLEALRGADQGIGATPKSLKGFDFSTEEQQSIFPAQAGYYIQQGVRAMAERPDYQAMTTDEKRTVMARVIARAREQAFADLYSTWSPEERQRRQALNQERTAAEARQY